MEDGIHRVIIVGGGSAGYAAARTAADRGARVAIVDRGPLGGLCILRGCMPTKTMLHAAHLVHEAAHHHTPGIGQAELSIDFAAVMANKDAKVARFKAAKIAGIAKDIPEQSCDSGEAGDTLAVVGWGSTYGAIRSAVGDARRAGRSVGHVHLRYLNPLPNDLGDVLQRFRHSEILRPDFFRSGHSHPYTRSELGQLKAIASPQVASCAVR